MRGAALSAHAVQRVLDENQGLILAAIEQQNMQKGHDSTEYLQKLHDNLMMLATLGDVQLNSAPGGCWPPTRPRHPSASCCLVRAASACLV